MNQTTYSKDQLIALKNRGAQYLVVARGQVGSYQRGQCVSWHKTHEAACRGARSEWLAVEDINDAIFYTQE